MKAFEELERMALNAAQEPAEDISFKEVARWQKLFSYTYEKAVEMICKSMSHLRIAKR